ncbi:hypothetical protein [Acidithiobacillus sp.]|uniref:hypothetical protein n=1 Tax=Acidithiobacillus sp. TaxID=1872118 RepID=UPI003D022ADC
MPGHPNALLHDAHHPFPEPLIPHGEPGEAETTDLQAAITAWERSGRPESFEALETSFLAFVQPEKSVEGNNSVVSNKH